MRGGGEGVAQARPTEMVSLTSLLDFRARRPRSPACQPQDDTTSLSATDPDSRCDSDSDSDSNSDNDDDSNSNGELPPVSADFPAVPLPPGTRDTQPAAAAAAAAAAGLTAGAAAGLTAGAVADTAAVGPAGRAAQAAGARPAAPPVQSRPDEAVRPSACAALSARKAAAVPSCPTTFQSSDGAAAYSAGEPIGVPAEMPAAVEPEASGPAEPDPTGKGTYAATNTADKFETAALAAARQHTPSSYAIPPGSTAACSAGGAQLPAAGEAAPAAVQASAPHQAPCRTGGPAGVGPAAEHACSRAVIVDAQI